MCRRQNARGFSDAQVRNKGYRADDPAKLRAKTDYARFRAHDMRLRATSWELGGRAEDDRDATALRASYPSPTFHSATNQRERSEVYLPNVNEAVACWIRETGSTHAQLARAIGMGDTTLRDKRTGESDFTVGELLAIARITGVPAPWLIADIRPGRPAKGETPIPRGTGKRKEIAK